MSRQAQQLWIGILAVAMWLAAPSAANALTCTVQDILADVEFEADRTGGDVEHLQRRVDYLGSDAIAPQRQQFESHSESPRVSDRFGSGRLFATAALAFLLRLQ